MLRPIDEVLIQAVLDAPEEVQKAIVKALEDKHWMKFAADMEAAIPGITKASGPRFVEPPSLVETPAPMPGVFPREVPPEPKPTTPMPTTLRGTVAESIDIVPSLPPNPSKAVRVESLGYFTPRWVRIADQEGLQAICAQLNGALDTDHVIAHLSKPFFRFSPTDMAITMLDHPALIWRALRCMERQEVRGLEVFARAMNATAPLMYTDDPQGAVLQNFPHKVTPGINCAEGYRREVTDWLRSRPGVDARTERLIVRELRILNPEIKEMSLVEPLGGYASAAFEGRPDPFQGVEDPAKAFREEQRQDDVTFLGREGRGRKVRTISGEC